MTARLTAAEMTLVELLSGAIAFEIPEFQRDYRWTVDEARQLFEDVTTAALDFASNSKAAPYFLGAMVLLDHAASESDAMPGARRADIVDGQQRLVTLSILISCLRDLEKGDRRTTLHAMVAGRSSPYQVTLRSDDQQQLVQRVLIDGATRTRGPSSPASASVDNMLANRNLFLRELRALTAEERAAFADYLRTRCRLLVMRTTDIDYAYQIFLTINDRGRQLTREDILRAEIIGPLTRDQKARYDSIVGEFARYQTETLHERPKKGKTFFSHLAAIYGAKGKSIIAEIRKLVRETGGPAKFTVQVFVPLAEAYLLVKQPPEAREAQEAELEHYLTALRWYETFGDDDWVPLAMIWLSRFSAVGRNVDFFRALDRFSLALRALGTGFRTRERRYVQIRASLVEAATAPDPDQLFALTASEQRLALNRLAKRSWATDPQLCRLLLTRLDAYLSGKPLAAYAAAVAPKAYTVEHVLPRAANPPQEWLVAYPSARRRTLLAQCLGNLVLVPPKINEDAGARPFADKRAIYFRKGEHALRLTNELATLGGWPLDHLLARQKRLVRAVQEIWRLEGDIDRIEV